MPKRQLALNRRDHPPPEQECRGCRTELGALQAHSCARGVSAFALLTGLPSAGTKRFRHRHDTNVTRERAAATQAVETKNPFRCAGLDRRPTADHAACQPRPTTLHRPLPHRSLRRPPATDVPRSICASSDVRIAESPNMPPHESLAAPQPTDLARATGALRPSSSKSGPVSVRAVHTRAVRIGPHVHPRVTTLHLGERPIVPVGTADSREAKQLALTRRRLFRHLRPCGLSKCIGHRIRPGDRDPQTSQSASNTNRARSSRDVRAAASPLDRR